MANRFNPSLFGRIINSDDSLESLDDYALCSEAIPIQANSKTTNSVSKVAKGVDKTNVENPSTKLLETLANQQRKLFEEGLFSDFIIISEKEARKETFHVHRGILAVRSPYFAAMLTNEEFVEAKTGVMRTSDFGGDTVRSLLAFIYAGEQPKGDENSPLDQMKELFRAADMYQMDELKAICEQRLVEKLSVESVLDLLVFAAELYEGRAKTLKSEAIKFVNANKGAISTLENGGCWKEFVRDHHDLLSALYLAAV